MEIMTSQAVHVRAPTSPNSSSSMHFHSAPTSPIQRALDASHGYDSDYAGTALQAEQEGDDFEFEASKKFETSPELDYPLDDDRHREQKQKQRQRGGSMPTMAFADELFSNGLVLPLALKLPPRLQRCVNGSASPSPPRSLAPTRFRFPRRRSAWNDEFDPFAAALNKVRDEEERRGKNHHGRARSLSPFKSPATPPPAVDSAGELNSNNQQQQQQCNESMGSVYGRILGLQNKDSPSGKRVRPLKGVAGGGGGGGEEWNGKPVISTEFQGQTIVKKRESTDDQMATRKRKVKEFLHRYASFGRENKKKNEVKLREQIAAMWKGSYLQKKLSFNNSKDKENSQSETNKKACGEPKNTEDVEQYQPRLALCLSFHGETP